MEVAAGRLNAPPRFAQLENVESPTEVATGRYTDVIAVS
jgi:hypothetical protein